MSIQFKKPRKRMQMRVFGNQEEEDRDSAPTEVDREGDDIPPPPPAPNINNKKDKGKTKQTLLSFGDEVEEDDEIFQVKKSSHSKKLMKMLDRERKDAEKKQVKDKDRTNKRQGREGKEEGRRQQQGDNNSRNNDSYNKAAKSIEGIILTGREAISAVRCGDMSGSEEEDELVNSRLRTADVEDDVANVEGAERFRHPFVKHSGMSVRALLDSGAIPDAAVIHAARKKRQQARQIGEYIPIQSTGTNEQVSPPHKGGAGSRLVREDGEGDGSDEDPDRIDVKGVHTHQSKRERIKMAATHNGSDPDSGGEEWETQQIRKAVTHSQIVAAQQETFYNAGYAMPTMAMADVELNPFSIASTAVSEMSLTHEHLRPLAASGQVVLTPQHLAEALRSRLEILKENKMERQKEYDAMEAELDQLNDRRELCGAKAPSIASRYEFYQKLRAYITDLIECLDEKMPALVALESRAMTLHRRKTAFLIERRRQDVRDQAHEVLQPITGKKDTKDEERSRRCAEREGRRVRRRRAREKELCIMTKHREGESSDDEVPQNEMVSYQSIQDQIKSDSNLLFSDALEDFSTLAGVLSKMEEWRKQDMAAYVEAYAGMCLPKLIGPFLRLKLLLWNPITDEEALDWEKMQWYRGLMLYGLTELSESEEVLADDPDVTLIPSIVTKIIIPKIADLVEGSWDPMSGTQTRRLSALLRRAATLPGPGANSKHMTALADAIIKRSQTALQHDVFIPILPKSLVDVTGIGKSGAPSFLRRQACMGVKLFSNLAALHGTVADTALAPLALTALLQRYLVPGLRCCPAVYASELSWSIASCLPKAWLSIEEEQMPIQQFASVCQEIQSQLTDNPIHIKALEQIRSSIAILKKSKN